MSATFEHEIEPGPRRRCAKRRCPERARPGGSHRGALCVAHHAAAMRQWRTRRRAAGKSVAGASKAAPSSSPEALRERKRLSRARRTGAVTPEPCRACRSTLNVVATHPDPGDRSRIVWACRACRSALVTGAIERRQAEAREIDRRRELAEFAELCARIEELVAALPADVATALHEAASRGGPLGRLRPRQPLYAQALARAYANWRKPK